ncbi:uncharacterized protein LOC143573173 [Bidens hawaiensis]|uniref:uncharacterized protein LOC143573173 n=1 Tax=Bidens hawaiensis TaxID=980011 RepID=UPI00404907FD
MPYSVFAKLELGEPKLTRMSIQLADRSVKYPRGIVENMLVKIDKFVFPVDFVILYMDEDKNIPLILGRPFLATARALIDVCTGRLILRVGDEEVTFDIGRSMRNPHDHDDVLYIDTINSCICEHIQDTCEEDSLDIPLCVREVSDLVSRPLFKELVCGVDYEPPECVERIEDVDRVAEPKAKPSVMDPPSIDVKELPSHLEYAVLEDWSCLLVIISVSFSSEEKVKLLTVLKRHKHAIAWKIMDIKGISPSFCTHKILMEEKYKPVVQHQRRLNPNIQCIVKKEAIKILDAVLIYPISYSPWIPISPEDQGKTTFTCSYGTFAYRRMPFGLCNAVATFQRCWVAIFHDMIEYSKEVFMDEFCVFGCSFDHCLRNLERMLALCDEANPILNWEKCHFMVKEGIVLGHKISQAGLEVDRAKIDTIYKLPPPNSVKSIRSFLGHAGFYRRFIKDFSQIALPMTKPLVKDAPLVFSSEFLRAFELLKEKLVNAPIMVSADWSLPFELMCDTSYFAVGAV